MLESWDEYTNTPLKLNLTLQDEISLIYDKIQQWEYLILGGGSLNSIERLLALGLLHFLKLLRGKLDVSILGSSCFKDHPKRNLLFHPEKSSQPESLAQAKKLHPTAAPKACELESLRPCANPEP